MNTLHKSGKLGLRLTVCSAACELTAYLDIVSRCRIQDVVKRFEDRFIELACICQQQSAPANADESCCGVSWKIEMEAA